MPNYTENLQLEKPLQSEQYNIDVFNANADKIDQFAGQVPPYALTADKLTTGAKINGVNFKGDTDIVTGAGFYYETVTYAAGDLAFIYNQDGALELHKSLVAENIGHNPLTSTSYWEKVELGDSGGRNVGEIITSSLPLTDAGLHLLDGTRLSGDGIYKGFVDYIAELYNIDPTAAFFAQPTEGRTAEQNWQSTVSTYGVCGKFVYDSTNNTVRLPKITGILEGTTDVNALGDLVQAGLPSMTTNTTGNHTHTFTTSTTGGHNHNRGDMNITGNVVFTEVGDSDKSTIRSSSGAFTNTEAYGGGYGQIQPTNENWVQRLDFDASRSWTGNTSWNGDHSHTGTTTENGDHTHTVNTGVGVSSTVQPQTIKVLIYIVVATSVKEDIQVDIDNIATDLNGKVDRDLSNLTSTGEKHFINKSQISNCILEAPNGVLTYSGNTITLKAGVKVLIPDGKNNDGNLKSIEVTIPNDVTYTITESYIAGRQNQPIFINRNGTLVYTIGTPNKYFITDNSTSGAYDVNYSPKTNIMKRTNGTAGQWYTMPIVYIGSLFVDNNNNITNVNIEQPIKIFTNADKSYIGSLGMPSNKYINLTLGVSGSTYTALANGYFSIISNALTEAGKYYRLIDQYSGHMRTSAYSTGYGDYLEIFLPVKKGDSVVVYHNEPSTNAFSFTYAQGSESEAS